MPTTTHCEPKRAASAIDERRIGQRRGVDRDLLGAGIEHRLGIGDRADAAGHAERNVEHRAPRGRPRRDPPSGPPGSR